MQISTLEEKGNVNLHSALTVGVASRGSTLVALIFSDIDSVRVNIYKRFRTLMSLKCQDTAISRQHAFHVSHG